MRGPERGSLKIGVLINPASSRNRSRLSDLDALLAQNRDLVVRRIQEPSEVAASIADMRARGTDVIAIAGGDGTIQLAFAALFNTQTSGNLPALAVLPGGTTNMIANDIGATQRPARELERLLRVNAEGRLRRTIVRRRLMALQSGPDAPPVYGLFFGAAAIVQGTIISRRSVDRIGFRDSAGPFTGILSLFGPMLLGRNPIKPVRAKVTLDGEVLPEASYLAILGTTMERLSMGLRPFWDHVGKPLKVTLVREHPRYLMRVIWSGIHGRGHPELTPENGYISRNVDRIEVELTEPVVMDGEFFAAEPGNKLVLTAGPIVEFVR